MHLALRSSLVMTLLVITVMACGGDPVEECSGPHATILPDSAVIAAGDTITLRLTLLSGSCLPADTAAAFLRWLRSTTSDSAFVTLDSLTGLVTGVAPGKTHVRLRTVSGDSLGAVPVTVTPAPGPGAITLHISGPALLLVNQSTWWSVTATNASGAIVPLPGPPIWTSDDGSVATVSPTGTVTGHKRGTAGITVTAGSAVATQLVDIRARLVLGPANPLIADFLRSGGMLAIGDTIQFAAYYGDINGAWIGPATVTGWASSDTTVLRVSPNGRVIAVGQSFASVYASDGQVTDSTFVMIADVIAGLPATIRFAHTTKGVGPLTFHPSKGDPVTLSYGQSIERSITTGVLVVGSEGFPSTDEVYADRQRWTGLIREDDHVSLYATGWTQQVLLTPVWSPPATIDADSSLVRFIQSSGFSVVYLRPHGAPMDGLPQLCYFDSSDQSIRYQWDAQTLDIILRGKNLSTVTPIGPELARFAVTPAAGRATTYVITGETPATAEVLVFPDP